MEEQHMLSRMDLLNEIAETKVKLRGLVKNHEELNFYYKKPLNFNWFIHLVVFFIFLFLAGKIFDFLTYPLFKLVGVGEISDLAVYVFIALNLFFYIYFYVVYNKKSLTKKIKLNSDRINLINEENKRLTFYLENSSIIPRQYLNFHALNNFEVYIETGRADNLKEAMNLYEQEVRHEQNMNELRVLQNLQEATYQRANEAATLGWVNLFTKR